MPIVSSTIIADEPQIDGRRRITEQYTDQFGNLHMIAYLCPAVFDVQSVMIVRTAILNIQLQTNELDKMITTYPWDYAQTETTVAELTAYVRAVYREGKREELVPVARRILEWITNGRFTDTQVRNAFGLTLAQWTTLKNKMIALVSASTTIETATGE